MSDKTNITVLTPETKQAFTQIVGSKQYPALLKYLRTQQNNIAIYEWVRIKSGDKNIALKKAFYEGQFEAIKMLIAIFESCKKGEDE